MRAALSVRIAIVDSGADVSAPDIAAKQPLTYNAIDNSRDVTDTVGHGTFVASLAAGSASNSEGVAGIAGEARLIAIKASGAGMFTDFELAAAIAYAVDNGAKVINLSLGGTRSSLTEVRALQYAAAKDVLVVAAAGNEAQRGTVEYPAALLQPVGSNGVGGYGLAVGASTISGARAAFSNTARTSPLRHRARGSSARSRRTRRRSSGAASRSRARRRGSTATAAARRSPRPRWPAPRRSCGRPTRR